MTLGIFGGSFNPPHVGHLAVAQAAAEAASLGRVLWMPAATPPHKQRDAALASAADRLAMARLATAGNDRFDVSDLEVARAGVSFTVDTLRELRARGPEDDFALVLGGDSLGGFPSWREPDAIVALARLVVYARPGSTLAIPDGLAPHVTVVDAPALDVSSTAIRALLTSGRSARYLVPDAVLAYAASRGLYAPAAGGP